jgi:sortase A
LAGIQRARYDPGSIDVPDGSVRMQKPGLKRRLRWLEWGLYGSGVLLLAVFFYIRSEGERLSQEGLQAFEQAQTTAAESNGPPAGGPAGAGSGPSDDWNPDQALWDPHRVSAFEASRKAGGEAPLAALTIERLGIKVPVYNGTDEHNLNRGVGRIKGTARIDQEGNLGIAGHRDSFFRPLKDIELGDRIELETARGSLTYEVSSITITEPSDISVLAPTQGRTITLVTCYPFYYVGHAPKRYIVKATAEHFVAKT